MRRAAVSLALIFAATGVFLYARFQHRTNERTSPRGQYASGLGALYHGRYREALQRLTDVIRAEPRNARAYYFRGLAQRRLRALPAALDDLTKALTLDPSLTGAYYERALARQSLGDILGALADTDALLALRPGRAELRNLRAELLQYLWRYAEAEKELDLALKDNQNSYTSLLSRSVLKRSRSDTKGALADADAAIVLNRNLASAYIDKAKILASLGDRASKEDAIRNDTKAIELLPSRADLYAHRAETRKELYRTTEAIADLTVAVGLTPQVASYWVDRGHLYENRALDEDRESDYGLALQDQTKAIELAPKLLSGYFHRVGLSLHKKDYDSAVADAKTMLSLNPKKSEAYHNLCQIHYLKKDFEKALGFCDKAVDLAPFYATARNGRALVLMSLHRYRQAIADTDKAVDFNPEWDEVWRIRAIVELGAGQREKAAADCRRGLELNPNNAPLKRLLLETSTGGPS